MLSKEFIEEYKNTADYADQQALIAAYAAKCTGEGKTLTVPSIRAQLVRMSIYKNKPKTTKVYKADKVNQLVKIMKLEVNDSEVEYLNRLTVSLLGKMIDSIQKSKTNP